MLEEWNSYLCMDCLCCVMNSSSHTGSCTGQAAHELCKHFSMLQRLFLLFPLWSLTSPNFSLYLKVVEAPGASKCIGPGCFNVAQPDSVYCSNDCILKHAAATMKILSSGKDAKQKPKEKIKPKSEKPGPPKPQQQVSLCSWSRALALEHCAFFLGSPFWLKTSKSCLEEELSVWVGFFFCYSLVFFCDKDNKIFSCLLKES